MTTSPRNNLVAVAKITNRCCCNCPCCQNRRTNYTHANCDITTKEFEVICRCLKELGGEYIALSGGEPTMLPNLSEYIAIAHKVGLVARINTNGWGITAPQLEKWMRLGLDQVVLSVYGTDKTRVTKMRGNPLIFDKAMEAMRLLGAARQKHPFLFVIQVAVQKDNFHDLPALLRLCAQHHADMFWPTYLEDAVNLPELALSAKDRQTLRRRIKPEMARVIEENFPQQIAIKLASQLHLFFQESVMQNLYRHPKVDCRSSEFFFCFFPGGRVSMCPGQDYFMSENQCCIVDYQSLTASILEQLNLENRKPSYSYCIQCPHDDNVGFSLSDADIQEHAALQEVGTQND